MLDGDLRAALQRVDEAAAAPSPESAPFEAQYRALEELHKLLSVEQPPAEEAVVKARRGAVYLAVEEPHNAQKDLDAALTFFYPELAEFAAAAPERDGPMTREEVDAFVQKLPTVQVSEEHQDYLVYILELLNQLGILWSNRSQPTRALCYLLVCNNLSEPLAECDAAIASVRTHTHFYLAQVFGALGLPEESAKYCLATLEQQLLACVNAASEGEDTQFPGAREWVKNALRLVDYYLDTENIKDAATCLSACEYMMAHHLPGGEDVDADEQRADIFAAWAKVHQMTLQIAHLRREGYPAGVQSSGCELPCPSMEATLLKISPSDVKPASGQKMVFVPSSSVTNYDQARDVFKMGVAAAEQAKKVFVLDGFVTRHVRLLQQESLLYKRLIAFEPASKRQIAMQLRRLALLSSLLGDQLNPRAYCDLLQELYFECAEIAVEIFDLKRSRKGELDDKTNGYAVKAAHWYHQFVSLYYASGDASSTRKEVVVPTGSRAVLPPQEMTPREVRALLRGFFGIAHICGKIMYPRDIPKTATFWKRSLEAHESVLAIAKLYEKQQKPGAQQETIEQLFGAELAICRDMVTLLPEKIGQLVYNGRAL